MKDQLQLDILQALPGHSHPPAATTAKSKAYTADTSTSSASTDMARSVSRTRVVVRQSYFWPDQQLNFWLFIMLVCGGVLIGVFANFLMVQQRLGGLGIPW